MISISRSTALGVMVLLAVPPLVAQAPLSLREALERADTAAYANRIAAGDLRGRRAQATGALQGILPAFRLEAGYARTDNPLAAFGFTLQQRGVSAESFSPSNLNAPTPVTNWTDGAVAEVPLVSADAWLGRASAASASAAATAGAGWTRETTRVGVIQAYFGAILAREQVRTLEDVAEAARAHLRDAESRVSHGLATRSDALLASVQLGQLDAGLIEARGAAGIARDRLSLLLGQPADSEILLPDSLPSADRIRSLAAPRAPDLAADRLDVVAARLGLRAAEWDARRAGARFLPRLSGFGRYEWNHPDRPFGGRASYTFGLVAAWSPFSGGAEIADRRGALARADAARATAEAASAGATLQRRETQTRLTIAIAQLGIAEAAVTQAAEAHRIVTRKYGGGLATIAELLSAAAVETQARLGLAGARCQAILADAAARQAAGADLMALTVLEN